MEQLTQLNTDVPVTPRNYFREVSDLLVEASVNSQLSKEEYVAFCRGNYITQGDTYMFLNQAKDKDKRAPGDTYNKVLSLLASNKSHVKFSFGKYVTFFKGPKGVQQTPKVEVKQPPKVEVKQTPKVEVKQPPKVEVKQPPKVEVKQHVANAMSYASQVLANLASKLG